MATPPKNSRSLSPLFTLPYPLLPPYHLSTAIPISRLSHLQLPFEPWHRGAGDHEPDPMMLKTDLISLRHANDLPRQRHPEDPKYPLFFIIHVFQEQKLTLGYE